MTMSFDDDDSPVFPFTPQTAFPMSRGPVAPPNPADMERVVDIALEEDLRCGPDVTTLATVPADSQAVAHVRTREQGVICGIPVVKVVLDKVVGEGNYTMEAFFRDGDVIGMLNKAAGDVEQQVFHFLHPGSYSALTFFSSARTVSVG